MPMSHVEYNFGYGECHKYRVIAAQDIARYAEDKPGIYAWYFRLLDGAIDPSASMKSYDSLIASKSLEFTVKGNLKEEFQGSAVRIPFTRGNTPDYVDAVLSATTVFCPPLYIGISTGIKGRLKKHYDTLTDFLQRTPTAPQAATAVPGRVEEDSDIESNVFGERMGSLLKRNDIQDAGQLFVKVLYVDGATKRDLERAEFFVNRAFAPLCGIR